MAPVRKTKTEAKIREALAHLIRTKGFEGFTVSDITREAGINRGTFYAHYVDKYDLIEKQLKSVVAEISAILLDEGVSPEPADEIIPRERVLAAMEYVAQNHYFVGALTNDGKDLRLQECVKDAFGELMERQAMRRGNTSPSWCGLPHDYGREVLLSNTIAVIWLWLRKNCAETPEEITDIIYASKDISPCQLLE
jgi:AcrR family transcriptional regulator